MSKIHRFLPRAALPLVLLAASSTAKDDTHQLHALTDRNEITELINKLGRALDEGRFDDFRTIYTADATAKTPGGRADGRDALIAGQEPLCDNNSAGRRPRNIAVASVAAIRIHSVNWNSVAAFSVGRYHRRAAPSGARGTVERGKGSGCMNDDRGPSGGSPIVKDVPAVSYSPTPCRVQYHRRWWP